MLFTRDHRSAAPLRANTAPLRANTAPLRLAASHRPNTAPPRGTTATQDSHAAPQHSTKTRRAITTALLAILLPAALLSGCRADHAAQAGEDQNSATNYQAAAARAHSRPVTAQEQQTMSDGRPVLACFGDSLTAGYGVDAADSYPARLQLLLDKAGYRYRVVNLGISGETTKDGIARVDRVLALHPAITVVEFGGNDGLRGVPVASSRANLDSIVSALQHGGTRVALAGITLPPQFGTAYIQQFNQTYHVIADRYTVPLYPFLLQDVYGVPGSIQPDGVHPTAQGCRQVAKNIFGFLQPLLQK